MRIGIFAKIFPGTNPHTVLSAARAAGFSSVQYNMACSGLPSLPDAVPLEIAEAVARSAADGGINVEAISATYNMIHPDPAVRQHGLRSLDAIAARAHRMGTRLLTLCSGTRDPVDQWRYHPDNQTPEAWRDLILACQAALNVAERHDVDLGIEPEPANVVSSAAVARRLIDALGSPRIKIVLDPANLVEGASSEQWRCVIEDAIDLLGDRIALAHAKDRKVEGQVAAPGRGNVDFAHFVNCLRRSGYNGPLVAHGFTAEEAGSVAQVLQAVIDDGRG